MARGAVGCALAGWVPLAAVRQRGESSFHLGANEPSVPTDLDAREKPASGVALDRRHFHLQERG
jgi:hypothetical protein